MQHSTLPPIAPSNSAGVFAYDPELANPRTAWRPDLVPSIVAWLAGIPAEYAPARVRVTSQGGFEALFVHRGCEVSFRFDELHAIARSCAEITSWAEWIVPFAPEQLDDAIAAAQGRQ